MSIFSKEGRTSLFEEFRSPKDKDNFNHNEVEDFDKVIDELETKISTIKKQNSTFISSLDDLNDKAFQRITDNRNLKLMIKHLEKEEDILLKEKAMLLAQMAKLNPAQSI